MSMWVLHEEFHARRQPLIAGRGLPKKETWIQKANLPGQDAKRRASVLKMYEGLSPVERARLRAQRAQRGLDVIDLFHNDVRQIFGHLTEQQKSGLLDVMVMTNKLRHKLRGVADGLPSEL